MAPKKPTSAEDKNVVKTSVATTSPRVTRSSIRRATGTSGNDAAVAVTAPTKITKKKEKVAQIEQLKVDEASGSENNEEVPAKVRVNVPMNKSTKKKAKSAPVDEVKPAKVSGADNCEVSPAEVPVEIPKKKKAKLAPVDDEAKLNDSHKVDEADVDEAEEVAASGKVSKTVVIEHCKQCNAFKTRAALVKEGLEKGVTGITVLVNPDKPRRGCFEIREEGGEKFVSLLDMKRPFMKMKELDMNQVIEDIVEKIK